MMLAALALASWPHRLVADDGAKPQAAPQVDFDRDIRPILSDSCFSCHGPDAEARKAGLRLDLPEGGLAELKSGNRAIVPGKPDESELVFRVEEADPTLHMPPPDSGKSITPEQAALLRRWVEGGAEYRTHWSFVPPKRPALPQVSDPSWPKDELDRFILARLDREGLRPNPEADKVTLIRRVTLDLTGLPPTPAEVDAFLADTSADAYETVVDRLLRSPRYGEHMARFWLDAARYGDTHGLHLDNYREMWPWRDWVIRSFNDNRPFDRFVVEQLAGDLLPDPTIDQLVATGYNRNHVSTGEGGSIEEEVYVRNVVDQVDTNGTVFLGLTIGCARCHDHKYDPVTQKDYYSLFAFFNSIDGDALDGNVKNWAPAAKVPSPEQAAQLAELDAQVAGLKARIGEAVAAAAKSYDKTLDEAEPEYVRREDYVWADDAPPPGGQVTNQGGPDNTWPAVSGPDHPVLSGATSHVGTAEGQAQHFFLGASPALKVGPGDTFFAYVFLDPINPPKEIMLQWNSGAWKHRAYWGENKIEFGQDGTGERLSMGPLPPTGEWVRLEIPAEKVGVAPGMAVNGWAFTQFGGTVHWDKAGLETFTPQEGQTFGTLAAFVRSVRAGRPASKELQEIAKLERSKRSEEQYRQLLAHFVETAYDGAGTAMKPLREELAGVEKRRADLDAQIPTTLVYRERKEPRPAYILDRGEYDRRKDEVKRAVPGFLPELPEGATADRLGFARWLVAPEHPLTARVAVNRLWQQVFGTGIVKTAEDFGLQGEPPSHPELLDWLSVQFREDGWDVKRLMKRLVMSAAYRQSARVTPESLAKDPANRLLSRGPRFRLDAEMLRDQALSVSGLLVEQMGGPSVKPPQPGGLWEAVGFVGSNTAIFKEDTGVDKVHRRSVYTFWKRTSPPPQMTTFDAPSRESCIVRRERTNTPLQALLLMNEPQYVEASRSLAARGLREGGSNDEDRLLYLFRLTTGRRPEASEQAALASELRDLREHFRADAEAAKSLIAIGETKPDPALDPVELAAWTMIGNTLLNFDEVLSK
jgi:mono/diheme cytochrome c family protein